MNELKTITSDVCEVISEVLEMPLSEISEDARLVGDLEADSLDIVDLVFSLNQKFNITLPKKSLIGYAEDILDDITVLVDDGKLTEKGAELLLKGPNQYTPEEVFAGQSISDIFFETKVIHWSNLCEAVIENSDNETGEELLIRFLEENL